MRINKAGCEHLSAGIDLHCIRPDQPRDFVVVADRADTFSGNGNCLGPGLRRIAGPDPRVGDDQCCRLRCCRVASLAARLAGAQPRKDEQARDKQWLLQSVLESVHALAPDLAKPDDTE